MIDAGSNWARLLTTLHLVAAIAGFNLAVDQPIIYNGPRNSHFGYQVRFLTNAGGTWLLVGAPKSASAYIPPEVSEPGALYKCQITDGSSSCFEVKVDEEPNLCMITPSDGVNRPCSLSESNTYIWHRKDNQWLGEYYHAIANDAMSSSTSICAGLDVWDGGGGGGNSKVTVCAPRWINQFFSRPEPEGISYYFMNGYCWELDAELRFSSVRPLHPLADINLQVQNFQNIYANGMAGLAVHYASVAAGNASVAADDDDTLLLGAPGVWDHTGTVVAYPAGERTPGGATVPLVVELLTDTLLGYAVSSGVFFAGGARLVVAGAPRDALADRHLGATYIYEGAFEVRVKKHGALYGEYFGAAVCAVDLDNDGLSELLVGAPLHYDGDRHDAGRVYVYWNTGGAAGDPLREQDEKLEGSGIAAARFGTTIAAVGDLDLDGFGDVAIGAPYEDAGAGVVYIYRGARGRVLAAPSQRIAAIDVSPSLAGFGWSVVGRTDVDGNGYADVAVGAYASSAAVLLRARSVVHARATLAFTPARVNVNRTDCARDGRAVPCVIVTACWNYTGARVPAALAVSYSVSVEEREGAAPRVRFYVGGRLLRHVGGIVSLQRGETACEAFEAHVAADATDVLNPLAFALEYGLPSAAALAPTFDPTTRTRVVEQLHFETDCGGDDVCVADLRASLALAGGATYVMTGRDAELRYVVTVANGGENAYETRAHVAYASAARFIAARSPDRAIACTVAAANSTSPIELLRCDVANPLSRGAAVAFELRLDASALAGDDFTVYVQATTTSQEEEATLADNRAEHTVALRREARVVLTASAQPRQLLFAREGATVAVAAGDGHSRLFVHTYDVYNAGPSAVNGSDLYLEFPRRTTDGSSFITFLQFVSKPTDKHIQCSQSPTGIDPFGIQEFESNATAYKLVAGETHTTLNCETTECFVLYCRVAALEERESAYVQVRLRLNETLLLEQHPDADTISFTSTATLELPGDIVQPGGERTKTAEATTTLIREDSSTVPAEGVAVWIIIVSVLAGLLLLVILVLVLMKAGFFKRKKKEEMDKIIRESSKEGEVYEEKEGSIDNRPLSTSSDHV
ncbi:PREDICTED: integrin alpha-9-like [Priapulus caudatus]|uniref:Integrin alpha-9-like n=1 Tax=Priapulus caudatus TaxID=37621 RepID=A0ABM1EGV9_PRICU|nr:PREDICTED: integrin alpha-9-like [Priapulus caudatus]